MQDKRSRAESRRQIRSSRDRYYEMDHLVRHTGVTPQQARELIKRYGNDRSTLLEHAQKLV